MNVINIIITKTQSFIQFSTASRPQTCNKDCLVSTCGPQPRPRSRWRRVMVPLTHSQSATTRWAINLRTRRTPRALRSRWDQVHMTINKTSKAKLKAWQKNRTYIIPEPSTCLGIENLRFRGWPNGITSIHSSSHQLTNGVWWLMESDMMASDMWSPGAW